MITNVLTVNTGLRFRPELARHGIEIATQTGATLHILYIGMMGGYSENSMGFVDRDGSPEAFAERTYEEFLVEKYRKRGEKAVDPVTRMAEKRGVETVVTFVPSASAKPDDLIRRYATVNGVELVVIGLRTRHGPLRYLNRTLADRLLQSTPLSVLTVRLDDRTGSSTARTRQSGVTDSPSKTSTTTGTSPRSDVRDRSRTRETRERTPADGTRRRGS